MKNYVISIRCADFPQETTTPGTRRVKCDFCGEEVWLSRETEAQAERNNHTGEPFGIACNECLEKVHEQAEKEGVPLRSEMPDSVTQAQVMEMVEKLMGRAKERVVTRTINDAWAPKEE